MANHFETNAVINNNFMPTAPAIQPEAFNSLFETYWKVVYNAAYNLLKNHDDAMDIVQDLFIYVWQTGPMGRMMNTKAYLVVAAKNKALKIKARKTQTSGLTEESMNIGCPMQSDRNILYHESAKRYEYLLGELPPQRRTIFMMRYHEGLCTQTIATHLNISRKTVQNQLSLSSDYIRASLMKD